MKYKRLPVIVFRILLQAFIMTSLLGCVTTEYKQVEGLAGYWVSETSDNTFTIKYTALLKGFSKVSDFCLLRCAKTCINEGYDYFVIADNRDTYVAYATSSDTQEAENLALNNSVIKDKDSGLSYNPNKLSVPTISYYIAGLNDIVDSMADIICFNEKPNGYSYDAHKVKNSLIEKYGLTINE